MKICLLWHNLNSSNYGVGALGLAHIDMLASAARENGVPLEIETVGTHSVNGLSIREEIEGRLGIKVNHTNFGLRETLKKILSLDLASINVLKDKNYDLVFDIGEGDSFADIYGLKRFSILCLSKFFALRENIPLILSPQTIGPFNHAITSRIATYLMKRSAAIYVRDHKSAGYLDALGISSIQVSDVAFLLPFDRRRKIPDSIGINVSALLWHGGYTANNQFKLGIDYRKVTLEIIAEFLSRNRQIHLISHVISAEAQIEDDFRVSQIIKDKYFPTNSQVVVAPQFKSPIEAKSYISQMTFFIGSRMHATIAALSTGVPTIPIAYSRKFSGVFESINYPYTIDAFGCDTDHTLCPQVLSSYDNHYDEMSRQAETSCQTARERLGVYSEFLRGVIK